MQIIKSFWKPIAWSFVVLVLSVISGNIVNEVPVMKIPHIDKVAHFGMYFVLAFLLIYDFHHNNPGLSLFKAYLFSVIIALIYGGSIEIIQTIPVLHRSCDIYDIIANSSGVFFAMLCYRMLNFLLNKVMLMFTKPKQNYSL